MLHFQVFVLCFLPKRQTSCVQAHYYPTHRHIIGFSFLSRGPKFYISDQWTQNYGASCPTTILGLLHESFISLRVVHMTFASSVDNRPKEGVHYGQPIKNYQDPDRNSLHEAYL